MDLTLYDWSHSSSLLCILLLRINDESNCQEFHDPDPQLLLLHPLQTWYHASSRTPLQDAIICYLDLSRKGNDFLVGVLSELKLWWNRWKCTIFLSRQFSYAWRVFNSCSDLCCTRTKYRRVVLRRESSSLFAHNKGVGGKPRAKPHRFPPLSNDKNARRTLINRSRMGKKLAELPAIYKTAASGTPKAEEANLAFLEVYRGNQIDNSRSC